MKATIPLSMHGAGSDVTIERREGSSFVSVFFTTAYVADLMLLTEDEARAFHTALGKHLSPEAKKDEAT